MKRQVVFCIGLNSLQYYHGQCIRFTGKNITQQSNDNSYGTTEIGDGPHSCPEGNW